MALAESSVEEIEKQSLKCRKCRFLVIEDPPHKILTTTDLLADEDQESSNTFNICDENLPYWITAAIEEGSWTKGKLSCPGCGCRLGGFDYVTRAAQPVYIVKSKVDLKLTGSQSLGRIVQPRPAESEDSSDVVSQSPDTTEGEDDEESEESNESNTESDHLEASRESLSLSSSDEINIRSKRQKEKLRRKRRRKEVLGREKVRSIIVKKENEQREAKMKELLEGEPELDQLGDDLLCPVCLDLLHEPFQVDPCGHVFCEPCLRRLGQKNPMNCSCPLCRTKIGFCKHKSGLAREIRENQAELYMKRKKFERSTPVFQYPLPWQPGWRNLLRGRPLGGNRLLRDNRVDVVRTILHQVPYYIPPVIIANIINIGIFAFMMGFIEIFPNLLAIVMGTNKTMSLVLNSSSELTETSGEALPTDDGSSADSDVIVEDLSASVVDSTFYYIIFGLTLVAAGLGQIVLNQELHGPLRFNRLTDMVIVILLTVLPLILLPAVLPWRSSDGTWLGNLIEKSIHFMFYHMNYYTAILLCFTVWFVYHVDINDDLLW